MIHRLVHHAEVIALKGDSYPLKNQELGRAAHTGPPLSPGSPAMAPASTDVAWQAPPRHAPE